MTAEIPIAEQFASIQGEGRYMGHPAVFLRTAGCNFICGGKAAVAAYEGTEYADQVRAMAGEQATGEGTWVCDTIAEWLDGDRYTIEDLYDDWGERGFLEKIDEGSHIVITGGEPLLQQESLTPFLDLLGENGHNPFVEVETNGSIVPTESFHAHVDQYNLSPKLENAGLDREVRYNPEVLETFVEDCIQTESGANADFKFVVGTTDDWQEIQEDFLEALEIPNAHVFLMPAGASQDDLLLTRQDVAELAIDEDVQFSERLQIVIWDEATGV